MNDAERAVVPARVTDHFSAVAGGAYDRSVVTGMPAAQVAGGDGLRCLISYRIIGGLAVFSHERQAYGNSLADDECAAESAILDRLQRVNSSG